LDANDARWILAIAGLVILVVAWLPWRRWFNRELGNANSLKIGPDFVEGGVALSYLQHIKVLTDNKSQTAKPGDEISREKWEQDMLRFLRVEFPPRIVASLGKRTADKYLDIINGVKESGDDVYSMAHAGGQYLAGLAERRARTNYDSYMKMKRELLRGIQEQAPEVPGESND
jgi:hypothetical protein